MRVVGVSILVAGSTLSKPVPLSKLADWKRIVIPLGNLPVGRTTLTTNYRVPTSISIRRVKLLIDDWHHSEKDIAPIHMQNGDELHIDWALELDRAVPVRQAIITIS